MTGSGVESGFFHQIKEGHQIARKNVVCLVLWYRWDTYIYCGQKCVMIINKERKNYYYCYYCYYYYYYYYYYYFYC